jgi:transcriptional regulator with XRE-family HTH domain
MNYKEITPGHQELLNKIGVELQRLRKNKNLSSSGLAKQVGISRNGYHQMEQGMVYFNFSTFLLILDFYQIPPLIFFNNLKNV